MKEAKLHIAQTTNLISAKGRRELSHYLIISLSHYLIISLSHYRGRFKIGCIVVMKGIIDIFSFYFSYPKTEELSKKIVYSANGETDYSARIAKDRLKRYLPALNVKCTVGILQKTDLLNFINMQNDLHRCIYSEAA